MNCVDYEVQEWEESYYIRNLKRMYKTEKKYKDPRKEDLEDFRHHRLTKWYYNHECKFIKKNSNRLLRRKLKRELYNEAYYRSVPHDYKTYGWITW